MEDITIRSTESFRSTPLGGQSHENKIISLLLLNLPLSKKEHYYIGSNGEYRTMRFTMYLTPDCEIYPHKTLTTQRANKNYFYQNGFEEIECVYNNNQNIIELYDPYTRETKIVYHPDKGSSFEFGNIRFAVKRKITNGIELWTFTQTYGN